MQKLKKSYCSVKYCKKNSVTHPELSYFRLPRYPERAAIWLKKIHRENTTIKKILVCEAHFEPRYISVNESRKRLISAAVPTLNLPYTVRYQYEPDTEMSDSCTIGTQTDDSPTDFDEDSIVAFTHTIKMERNDDLECKSEMDFEETDIFSHPECNNGEVVPTANNPGVSITETISLYNNTIQEKTGGEVHSDDFKFFALQLYFTSPKTYKVLQKSLKLPSISDLYRLCIPMSTEITENTVRALKVRVNDMTDDEKQCAVCIGTMALRPNLSYDKEIDRVIGFHEVDGVQTFEPAKFLFILMVRGLFSDWKHVISYSLLAPNQNYRDVKTQLDKVFQKLFDIGLNVRVFISDMESEFMSATLERKITPELPYFFINGHKIYYMYDPPHILRAVWDILPKNDYQVDEALIKWKYILDFYDLDMARSVRFAPKLTVDHMKLKVFKNDKVSMAAQVFSNTTAAGISACIDMKLIDESAKHTVDCILKLNKLFDLLNFSSFAGKNQKIFNGEQSQVDFLRETMFWLDQMRLVDSTGKEVNYANARFIRGYKITINTILSLYEHFRIENRNFVKPQFTRDCIDAFIDKVRAKYCETPTCKSMARIIKTLPIFSIFTWKANKRGSDELEIFLKLANDVTSIQVYTPKVDSTFNSFVDLTTVVDIARAIPKKSRLQYIAAYVLHEASQRYNNCDVLNAYVLKHNKGSGDEDKENGSFRDNADDDAVFVSPPPDFVQFIRSLDTRIKSHLQIQTVNNPILTSLMKSVEHIEFASPTRCECFPLDYIKELYVIIRFNTLLNYNNEELTNYKKYRKTFTVYEYC